MPLFLLKLFFKSTQEKRKTNNNNNRNTNTSLTREAKGENTGANTKGGRREKHVLKSDLIHSFIHSFFKASLWHVPCAKHRNIMVVIRQTLPWPEGSLRERTHSPGPGWPPLGHPESREQGPL